MSRPLRIQYPDAWYHIMNRGRRFERIFSTTDDYEVFLQLLKETADMWNIRVAAYCLMPNHYHILVQTPEAKISRSMRHLNGVYTQLYNRQHQCDGTLFRGRYKSILVSEDDYLLQLVRYIHRNPIKAGLVKRINAYPWSSHKGYLSVAKKWEWLDKKTIFAMLTPRKKEWVSRYRKFIKNDCKETIRTVLDGNKWPLVIGSADFIDRIKGLYYDLQADEEMPQVRSLAPDMAHIIKSVCAFYKVDTDHLFASRRGVFNEPRNIAIYLSRRLRRDRLNQIGKDFRMEKYSSVSSIIERVKARLKTDKKLKKRVDKISDEIIRRQGQP